MKSGIYCLKSKIKNKYYVGFSKNVYYRKTEHLRLLRRNEHFNNVLQNHYNKYGIEDLSFQVLEKCEPTKMAEREIFWINEKDSFKNGFNLTAGGEGSALLGTGKKASFENIKTGEIIENISIIEFAEKINCHVNSVYLLVRDEKIQTCNGWKIKGEKLNFKTWPVNLKNTKTKEIVSADSPTKMAKKLNMSVSSVRELINNKNVIRKGWCNIECDLEESRKSNQYDFKIKNERTGQIVSSHNITKTAKDLNLDVAALHRLINNKQKNHKGWISF